LVPDPKNHQSRNRAYRLRSKVRQKETLEPEDAAWLADYETAQSVGASASSRTVHVEETQLAVGTGSAAEAAAAASLAREEGRRLDYLTGAAIKALAASGEIIQRAADMYGRMTAAMLERNQQLEDVHLGMLGAVRENYLARTQAEVDAIQAQSKDGNVQDALLAALLGGIGVTPKKLPKGPQK
jgi:hypothetical protein